MSEADDIGWNYTQADIKKECRESSGDFTDFELMLHYHEMSEADYSFCSSNEQQNLWWNYRNIKSSTI